MEGPNPRGSIHPDVERASPRHQRALIGGQQHTGDQEQDGLQRDQDVGGKSEAADILHVSPKTVSRWAKEGKLPFLKTLGGHRRYPAAEIRQLADELQV